MQAINDFTMASYFALAGDIEDRFKIGIKYRDYVSAFKVAEKQFRNGKIFIYLVICHGKFSSNRLIETID